MGKNIHPIELDGKQSPEKPIDKMFPDIGGC
jgi:hypothetical protein